MGCKLKSYVDEYGNVVRDKDIVVYKSKEWSVIYISDNYVNLYSESRRVGLHVPFEYGVPTLKDGKRKKK